MDFLLHLCYTMVVFSTTFNFGLGCQDDPVTDDIAGSTVNIEVLPKSINELITVEINITCTPQDLPLGTKKILFMELGKEGEHPLASLDGPALELGSDVKNNMEARGRIAKTVSESYLQLTIKRPFVDDVGVYCCRVFYQNEFGELKMGHVYADVSIENDDKAVLIHLLQKVSDLERYTKDLEKDLLKEKNYTKELEQTIMDKDTQMTSRFDELEMAGSNRSHVINDIMERVTSRFDELEMAGSNRSHVINDIIKRESFSVAFSTYGTRGSFSNGETLVFKNVVLNIGSHYDMKTGVFTTPKDGLYVFNIFVYTTTNDDLWVKLKVNDVVVADAFAKDIDTYDQSSFSTVIHLKDGDRVWPYVQYGASLGNINDKFTVFNGYLLKLALNIGRKRG